jgi:hypothetical protein
MKASCLMTIFSNSVVYVCACNGSVCKQDLDSDLGDAGLTAPKTAANRNLLKAADKLLPFVFAFLVDKSRSSVLRLLGWQLSDDEDGHN